MTSSPTNTPKPSVGRVVHVYCDGTGPFAGIVTGIQNPATPHVIDICVMPGRPGGEKASAPRLEHPWWVTDVLPGPNTEQKLYWVWPEFVK